MMMAKERMNTSSRVMGAPSEETSSLALLEASLLEEDIWFEEETEDVTEELQEEPVIMAPLPLLMPLPMS